MRSYLLRGIGTIVIMLLISTLSGASGKIPDETGEVFRGGACAFTAKARQANLPDAPLSGCARGGSNRIAPPATLPSPRATALAAVESEGVVLTVTRMERTEREKSSKTSVNSPEREPYLVLELSINNVRRDQLPFSLAYFSLSDASGREYPAGWSQLSQMNTSMLSRGDKVYGLIGFAIDPKASGFILSYDPQRFLQQHGLSAVPAFMIAAIKLSLTE